jgi:hypothetical protein
LTGTVGKLRSLLTECGLDGSAVITNVFGCYQLDLSADTWVDLETASAAKPVKS